MLLVRRVCWVRCPSLAWSLPQSANLKGVQHSTLPPLGDGWRATRDTHRSRREWFRLFSRGNLSFPRRLHDPIRADWRLARDERLNKASAHRVSSLNVLGRRCRACGVGVGEPAPPLLDQVGFLSKISGLTAFSKRPQCAPSARFSAPNRLKRAVGRCARAVASVTGCPPPGKRHTPPRIPRAERSGP